MPREGRAYEKGRKGWRGILNWILDLAPGLARVKAVVAAAWAVALLVASWLQ